MEHREYYKSMVEGNTVRKQQAVPKREAVPQKSREQIIRERDRRLAAKRNRQHALSINRGYVVFLTGATLVCCMVCALFIHLQSNITIHMASIASLETQISNLKQDNAAAENRLATTMTLEEIKAKAGELGLVYPASDQIQYYSVENSDYMNQYGDVASR